MIDYALYDSNDYLICYYHDINEISNKLNYAIKELNRKFRNSLSDYIVLYIDNHTYKLYKLS